VLVASIAAGLLLWNSDFSLAANWKQGAENEIGDAIHNDGYFPQHAGNSPPNKPSGVVGDAPAGLPRDEITGCGALYWSRRAIHGRVGIARKLISHLLVTKVDPSYPAEARKQHVAGTVLLCILIDRDGNVSQVQVVSGHPLLIQAAVEAVKQWKYRPYLLHGKRVEVVTTVLIKFLVGKTNAYQVIARQSYGLTILS
jgi:TonB family protein